MRLGTISTGVAGIGLTVASTFASSLGLSLHQERIGFAIGIFLIFAAGVLFVVGLRAQKKKLLPLLDRLRLKIDEAKALAKQMHEVAPGPTLEPARVWRGEVYELLRGEKPDWAQRFRESTEEIPQITDQTFFPARHIFEDQIGQLEDLLSCNQH